MSYGEFIVGSIMIRTMSGPEGIEVGRVIKTHTHNFDHLSLFFLGLWRVRCWSPQVDADGKQVMTADGHPAFVLTEDFEREAPFWKLIPPNCTHEFTYIGPTLAPYVARFIGELPLERQEAFYAEHAKTHGKAWCVYSHRTPQGDVSLHATGWDEAYR